jgi:hypothetical protein
MNTIFIAGHARLPSGMAAKNVYETLTITAEIDRNFGVILSAGCTLATEHGRRFLEQLLRGYSLEEGPEKIIEAIRDHYFGKAANALASAVRELHKQYLQYKETKAAQIKMG